MIVLIRVPEAPAGDWPSHKSGPNTKLVLKLNGGASTLFS